LNLDTLYRNFVFLFLWFTPFIYFNSQTISFKINKTTLYKNEFLSISITFSKDAKKEFNAYKGYQFPDIPDMQKSHTYFKEKEGTEKISTITQWYEPTKAGTKTIPAITITTRNNKVFKNPAIAVSVLSETTDNPTEPPSENWIGQTKILYEAPDVQWIVHSDVQTVYPMQPIHIMGYVLIPLESKIPFTFVDTHNQKQALSKLLKNTNCIQYDKLADNELKQDTISKNKQTYLRLYIIDQFLFPLKECVIDLPATQWYIYGYKTGTNDEGIVRLPEKVVLKSNSIKIKVKKLPPYPKQELIPVGTFTIRDFLEQKRIRNGNTTYLTVTMETNTDLSSIGDLEFTSSTMELLGSETVSINIVKGNNWKVRKVIRYQINPLRSGQYHMGDAFRFIFFNSKTDKYDTIYPKSTLAVYGDRISESNAILTNDNFYNRYNSQATSNIIDGKQDDLFNRLANMIILVMLAVTAILVIRK